VTKSTAGVSVPGAARRAPPCLAISYQQALDNRLARSEQRSYGGRLPPTLNRQLKAARKSRPSRGAASLAASGEPVKSLTIAIRRRCAANIRVFRAQLLLCATAHTLDFRLCLHTQDERSVRLGKRSTYAVATANRAHSFDDSRPSQLCRDCDTRAVSDGNGCFMA